MEEENGFREKDIFRDTLLRYMGYSNEVGESFRAVVDVRLVHLSYVMASSYVLADTISKSKRTWRREENRQNRGYVTFATATDVILWQSFASVIIPGFVINRTCAATRWLLKRTPLKTHNKWISVAVGLVSIPIIIHPIDKFVDYAMDNTVRPLLATK